MDTTILTTEEASILAAAGPEGYFMYRHGSSKTRQQLDENENDTETADIEVIDNDYDVADVGSVEFDNFTPADAENLEENENVENNEPQIESEPNETVIAKAENSDVSSPLFLLIFVERHLSSDISFFLLWLLLLWLLS